jgi:dienelactone hydrolase
VIRAALAWALLAIAPLVTARVPEAVSFPSLDVDAASGKPVAIAGLLFEPAAGGAPRGAVVALHGCGGLYSNARGHAGQLTERHQRMAELLVAEGYAVLLPDSFGPRGARSICRMKRGERTITVSARHRDALGALAWLRKRGGIDPARIALLGWSNGGSTTLLAMNARDPDVERFRGTEPPSPFFAAAVAFYPGCTSTARAADRFAPAAPMRVYIGEADDWTPAASCVALGAAMAARSEPFTVTVYPGAYHDFDTPGLGRKVLADVSNGVDPARGVTIAGDPVARADAYARMKAFLREHLGPR